jgi:hypothetical protein
MGPSPIDLQIGCRCKLHASRKTRNHRPAEAMSRLPGYFLGVAILFSANIFRFA